MTTIGSPASPARLAANRRDALGAAVSRGEAASSHSGTAYGLRARKPLLLGEDSVEHGALHKASETA